ncbi:MAG: OmcA/MtrC family decaheme c-type cytochrome [Desulfobacterales bacterium]|jgi:OmcA/MtrC family decaheme c-type cytochrome|nr:OmcA/MtrC family decaheme c-type cytochrome [Desulfobacterales bacterium]
MIRRILRYLSPGLALLLVLCYIGCSGGNSKSDAVGEPEPELVAQTYNEKCALCHRPGSIADLAVVHSKEDNSPEGEITAVTIDAGMVTVHFKLFESENNLIPLAGVAASNIRFTIAKLVPGSNGDADEWVSYINRIQTIGAETPGTAPDGTDTPTGTSRTQADSQRANATGGVFVDNGDGSYRYQFSFDITNVISPVAVPYEPDLTHRVAMQLTGNVANASLDFVPNGGDLPNTRNIAVNASCNECHLKLGLHGGDRIQLAYCVTCHNPGTTDANSGNTVDFKVMVHKIHMGENLPSVQTLGWRYVIWGNADSEHDYSEVVFPQDVRFPGLGEAGNTCAKCHSHGDAADGDNWNLVPTREACTSCHDTISFTDPPPSGFTLHSGGARSDNSRCAACHPATGGVAGIIDSHTLAAQVAAKKFKYNIISVSDADGGDVAPGDFVKVTFSVTDPTNADAPYNILTHPAFTSRSGLASRLAVLIGWETSDITNTGSGNDFAQPVSIDTLSIGSTPATDNLDGTFSVTSKVAIPADVTGSGVAGIDGHPAGDFDEDGTFSDRIPVTNVVKRFSISGASPENRRTVVNIANCNRCHGQLSLHGNNRTDEPQLCAICHNANATDRGRRPGDTASTADGKLEEAIDFKYMVHSIHAGSADHLGFREKGIVVYGFGGSVNDFSEVALPAGLDNLRNCTGCHTGSTFALPLESAVQPTTVLTEADPKDPDDDINITPTAAVCSSCHDGIEAKTHMSDEGGKFDFVAFAPADAGTGSGSQADVCGPGPVSAQPAGHSERTDCCSCHGPN